ncbi:hypothetical protein JL2886_01033 [Phaeobacter gallaeciensis]|uniref:Uncharacterized protein n=1 Tax=Phaeobacter gallaeciensis TaxID=60890 RepID=A0A1B0ZP77_9RHOB|nr:hypothetical protein JL2886_01033 [Phaeobacter gallaeciensis]
MFRIGASSLMRGRLDLEDCAARADPRLRGPGAETLLISGAGNPPARAA